MSGAAEPESYTDFLEAIGDTESLTVLVVAGKSRAEVIDILQVDLDTEVPDGESDDLDVTGWAVADVPGGVLGLEHTGYGDPTLAQLRELSSNRGAAAVVRSNVMAHQRFGCARDGVLLFDDDEFMYTNHPDTVPLELRDLFDLVHDDLESDDVEIEGREEGPAEPFSVGLAMAAVITGIHLLVEDVMTARDSGYFAGPTQTYGSQL